MSGKQRPNSRSITEALLARDGCREVVAAAARHTITTLLWRAEETTRQMSTSGKEAAAMNPTVVVLRSNTRHKLTEGQSGRCTAVDPKLMKWKRCCTTHNIKTLNMHCCGT